MKTGCGRRALIQGCGVQAVSTCLRWLRQAGALILVFFFIVFGGDKALATIIINAKEPSFACNAVAVYVSDSPHCAELLVAARIRKLLIERIGGFLAVIVKV